MSLKNYVATALCILVSRWLPAQIDGLHLSWNSNEANATSQTISMTWLSNNKAPAIVKYGTDSNRLKLQLRGDRNYSAFLQAYVFKATITNLEPGKRYYYRIENKKKQASKIYNFQTSDNTDTAARTMVGVWSDTQDNKGNFNFEKTDSIVKKLARLPLHFTIHTGDIVNNGSVVTSWKTFFRISQPLNAKFPLMSVTGNHDVVNDNAHQDFQKPFPVYYELFNLPHNQLNYSFIYGNTKFIAINSGYAKGAEKNDVILFKPGSAEYQWLEQELIEAKNNSRAKWIIVYCHYPVYAFGVSLVTGWQQHLTPLLDKYGVDLCISCHRHVYERHKAIRKGNNVEQANKHIYNEPGATVYITNGSAGGSLQGLGGNDMSTMIFTPNEKLYTFAIMDIGKDDIRFDVYDIDGRRIDFFIINKL